MDVIARTILIVDASPEDRELYRRYLQRDPDYSYTILEASLGQQGLDLWRQQQPDVGLLDYSLPDSICLLRTQQHFERITAGLLRLG